MFNKEKIQLDKDVIKVLNILYNDGLTWEFDEIKVNGEQYKIENNNKLKSKFILSPSFPEASKYYKIRRILNICFNMQRNLVEVKNYVPAKKYKRI